MEDVANTSYKKQHELKFSGNSFKVVKCNIIVIESTQRCKLGRSQEGYQKLCQVGGPSF